MSKSMSSKVPNLSKSNFTEEDEEFESDNDSEGEEVEAWRKPVSVKSSVQIQGNKPIEHTNHFDNTSDLNEEHKRSIIHLDIDCFYAQVEMLRNPELCNKPLGIQQKNIIVTCNYVARQLGVNKCTYVTDALKLCPHLILVSGEDLTHYRQMSYQISEFIKKYSPHVERLGLDENFVDVSELVSWRLKDGDYKPEFFGHIYAPNECEESPKTPCNCGCELRLKIASQIAADIREALQKELGITSCAGIAHNKLLAKLVGAVHKPNQQTLILPHMALGLISSLLSVGKIPGIGLTTGKMLKKIGITTIKDLQSFDKQNLEREFGPVKADFLIKCSQGIDESPVIKFGLPQTLSDEDSFKCCSEHKDAEERMKNLLISLLKRLIEDGRVPQTVRLTIRRVTDGYKTWQNTGEYVYRKRESRQCSVPRMIFTDSHWTNQTCETDVMCEKLMPLLMTLFKKLVDTSKPFHLTLLSIGFTNLVKSNIGQGNISSLLKKHAAPQSNKMAADSCAVDYPDHHEAHYKSKTKNSQKEKKSSIKNFFKQSLDSHLRDATLPKETNPSSQSFKQDSASDALLHDQQVTQNKIEVNRPDFVSEKSCTPIPGLGEPSTVFEHSDSMSDNITDKNMNAEESTKISHLNKINGVVKPCINGVVKPCQSFEMPETVNKSECQNEESLQRLLPKDIDAKTIAELPYDLQVEILAQYGILAEGGDGLRQYTMMPKTMTTRSHAAAAVQLSHTTPPMKRQRSLKRDAKLCDSDIGSISKVRKFSLTEGSVSLSVGEIQEPSLPDNCSHTVKKCTNDADCEDVGSLMKPSKVNEDSVLHDLVSCTEIKIKCPNGFSSRESIKSDVPLGTLRSENKLLKLGQSSKNIAQSAISNILSPNVSCLSPSKSGESTKQCDLVPKGSGHSPKDKVQFTKGRGQSPKGLLPSSNCHSTNGIAPKLKESHLMSSLFQKRSSDAVAPLSSMKSTIVSNEIDPTVFSALPKNIQSEILAHIAMDSSPKPSFRKYDSVGDKTSKSSTNKQDGKPCKNTLLNYFNKKS